MLNWKCAKLVSIELDVYWVRRNCQMLILSLFKQKRIQLATVEFPHVWKTIRVFDKAEQTLKYGFLSQFFLNSFLFYISSSGHEKQKRAATRSGYRLSCGRLYFQPSRCSTGQKEAIIGRRLFSSRT